MADHFRNLGDARKRFVFRMLLQLEMKYEDIKIKSNNKMNNKIKGLSEVLKCLLIITLGVLIINADLILHHACACVCVCVCVPK